MINTFTKITDSPYEIKDIILNKSAGIDDIRILYDPKTDMYGLGYARDCIHYQLFRKMTAENEDKKIHGFGRYHHDCILFLFIPKNCEIKIFGQGHYDYVYNYDFGSLYFQSYKGVKECELIKILGPYISKDAVKKEELDLI